MQATDDPQAYLSATAYLNFQHPTIALLNERLATGSPAAHERALRIHEFVQNEILFGWSPRFDREPASSVLASRVGFCNTKSTLFGALLRAAGIPARLHVVGISAAVLSGLIDPRSTYVDHSWTELWLHERWIRLDSYVLDRGFFLGALSRLRKSGQAAGFGTHLLAHCDWDGHSDRFVQFREDAAGSQWSDVDFGVFHDIADFNDSGLSRKPKAPVVRILMRVLLSRANQRVCRIRAESRALLGTAAFEEHAAEGS
jgi:Transglutaminase-like superfamily